MFSQRDIRPAVAALSAITGGSALRMYTRAWEMMWFADKLRQYGAVFAAGILALASARAWIICHKNGKCAEERGKAGET